MINMLSHADMLTSTRLALNKELCKAENTRNSYNSVPSGRKALNSYQHICKKHFTFQNKCSNIMSIFYKMMGT